MEIITNNIKEIVIAVLGIMVAGSEILARMKSIKQNSLSEFIIPIKENDGKVSDPVK